MNVLVAFLGLVMFFNMKLRYIDVTFSLYLNPGLLGQTCMILMSFKTGRQQSLKRIPVTDKDRNAAHLNDLMLAL